MIRRKSSSASAGGGSPGSKSLHLSPLSKYSERHPRKSQTLFTFPDPGPLSAGSGTRDIYNIKSILQVSMWACKITPYPLIKLDTIIVAQGRQIIFQDILQGISVQNDKYKNHD